MTQKTDNSKSILRVMRILSAIILVAIAVIHLILVFDGTGGVLGVLFVLNAVAGTVLGFGMLAIRERMLQITTGLSLLFIAASFLSLVLALTIGLFGITVAWSFTLVPQTFVVEGVGILVLAITSALVVRAQRTI